MNLIGAYLDVKGIFGMRNDYSLGKKNSYY